MLARVDAIPGVSRTLAECSGHYFLVELAGADADAVGARAIEVLRRGARVLPPAEAAPQLEARRRGEPWLGASEARSLSYMEGRILANRVSVAVGREARLDEPGRERLAEAVREETFHHVEEIFAGRASPGAFFEHWPKIAARIAERCGPLGGSSVADLAELLLEHFGAPSCAT